MFLFFSNELCKNLKINFIVYVFRIGDSFNKLFLIDIFVSSEIEMGWKCLQYFITQFHTLLGLKFGEKNHVFKVAENFNEMKSLNVYLPNFDEV